MNHVSSQVLRNFTDQVINIWPDLTRQYVGPPRCESASGGNATGCVSSFLPLNRTFVVAGGRFREPYYWDSFWILEGLLRTQGSFTEIALNIIENFLDLVDSFGFVPNGARRYYLNRSQPPLLTQMVKTYVDYTNDTSIIQRALPTLEKEYMFWMNNQSVPVTGKKNATYTLNHYAVLNTQPRPESFREDYITANNASYYATSGIIYPAQNLTEAEKEQLYANLASGAESGWDYSSRWLANPSDAANDVYFPLRSLNTVQIVPVDLNSILYANEIVIADFHAMMSGNKSNAQANQWRQRAAKRSEAMTALMWDEEEWAYFDWNLTSSSRNKYIISDSPTQPDNAPDGYQVLFSPAQYYPFWTGAAPTWLKNNPYAVSQTYSRVAAQLRSHPGAISATNLVTGQQWDEPNVWPPLQYILIQGLLNTPPTFGTQDPYYQRTQSLALELAQNYVNSAFCTWRSTGGSTPQLPQLPGADPRDTGTIFEKYNESSINAAGGGGEYEVVQGFGW